MTNSKPNPGHHQEEFTNIELALQDELNNINDMDENDNSDKEEGEIDDRSANAKRDQRPGA